jgi:hypothetical protein
MTAGRTEANADYSMSPASNPPLTPPACGDNRVPVLWSFRDLRYGVPDTKSTMSDGFCSAVRHAGLRTGRGL